MMTFLATGVVLVLCLSAVSGQGRFPRPSRVDNLGTIGGKVGCTPRSEWQRLFWWRLPTVNQGTFSTYRLQCRLYKPVSSRCGDRTIDSNGPNDDYAIYWNNECDSYDEITNIPGSKPRRMRECKCCRASLTRYVRPVFYCRYVIQVRCGRVVSVSYNQLTYHPTMSRHHAYYYITHCACQTCGRPYLTLGDTSTRKDQDEVEEVTKVSFIATEQEQMASETPSRENREEMRRATAELPANALINRCLAVQPSVPIPPGPATIFPATVAPQAPAATATVAPQPPEAPAATAAPIG